MKKRGEGKKKMEEKRANKGQVAVILILITAVALVFYAISLNFARMNQIKTIVTVASDTAAAQMASYIAGYAQSLSESTLGGKGQVCASTSVLTAIIVLVIVIILSIVTWGAATAPLSSTMVAALAISIVASVASVIIQVIIQMGITSAWNSKTTEILSMRDQIIENAIQGALQKSVSDQKMVPDVYDMDRDRIWEPIDSIDVSNPADTIARFSVYYNERLKSAEKATQTDLQDFVDALEELLYEDPFSTGNTWGIYDDSSFSCSSAECNPCCVPERVTFYGVIFPATESCAGVSPCPAACVDCSEDDTNIYRPSLRPSSCSSETDWWTTCAAGGPYDSTYPWSYRRYSENPDSASFTSFREWLGRDDEHQLFEKNSASPNGIQTRNALPVPPPAPPTNFLLQDTTAYYVNPPFVSATDDRKGIFSFFYKVADWGVDLAQLDPATYQDHCYWWDDAYGGATCASSSTFLPQELLAQPLNLPVNPATLTYNTTPCVDGYLTPCATAAATGAHPLAVDKITFPENIVENDSPAPQCAQKALDGTSGFWKRGNDQYCTDSPCTDVWCINGQEWPYLSQCPKHGSGCSLEDGSTGDCLCGEGTAMSADYFADDVLDDIVNDLPDFIEWAEGVLASDLGADFTGWYDEVAAWIEPGTDPEPWGSNASSDTRVCSGYAAPPPPSSMSSPPCCYTCNSEDGRLVLWFKEIQMMIDRLEDWKDNTSYASSAGVCDEVWCVPGSGCPGGADGSSLGGSGPESNTFNDTDGDGTTGDIDDVIACLDWNVNDTVTTTDSLITATGNAQKFQECYSACSDVLNDVNLSVRGAHANQLCNALPRSLVPGFDGTFVNVDVTAGNKGSCADANYMADLRQSALEAQNQVAKFNQREVFLSSRVDEVDNILNNVLIPARDQFRDFLNGAAAELIQYRNNYTAEDEGLPYQAIYGWQDDPPDDNPTGEGMWHVVKVDARIPDKCDNLCGAGGGSDPGWPRVTTDSDGTHRCYTLDNTKGMVKFRTTRFDQGSTARSLFFPNGMPIWELRSGSGHPQRPIDTETLVDEMAQECFVSSTIRTLPDKTPQDSDNTSTDIYLGAFMLNKRLDGSEIDPACKTACMGDAGCEADCPRPDNVACWDAVHEVLASGVSSETCAEYYWGGSYVGGSMNFKFVDCVNF